MDILVIDVAAEYGGAKTILEQFLADFRNDPENRYHVVLSTLYYDASDNVTFTRVPWVKKSRLFRLWFDHVYIRRIIREKAPDKLLSLQNKTVASCGVPQEVYFHNALYFAKKRYTYRESKTVWINQRIIAPIVRHSLKKAAGIIVQAEWIKRALHEAWHIDNDRITVRRPYAALMKTDAPKKTGRGAELFFPANAAIYKNHITLLSACKTIWDEAGTDGGLTLTLTGRKDALGSDCRALLDSGDYPVRFVGTLLPEEMRATYERSVLVFPSLIETVGLPLIEAASCGAPILAADLPYAREALDGYDNVRFFAPENQKELEEYLRELSGAR